MQERLQTLKEALFEHVDAALSEERAPALEQVAYHSLITPPSLDVTAPTLQAASSVL